MSNDKRTMYKDWYDPASKKTKPRSTSYYHKKKKLQLDILTECDGLCNSTSESEMDTDAEDQQVNTEDNVDIVKDYVRNKNVSDEILTHSSCNVDTGNDANATLIHGSNFYKRNDPHDILLSSNGDNNDDWLDVFTVINTTTNYAINHDESDSASEEEKELYKNLTKENRERKKNEFLNQKILKKTNISNDNKEWYKYHIFCSHCKNYIGERTTLPNTLTCPCCNVIIENVKNAPYFLTLDIKYQLKQLLENPLVQPHLQYKLSRQKENIDYIEDVFDGKLYKFLSSQGQILHDDQNFSYILNTDGCKAANSSTTSIWPVYMKIVELPPEIRNKNLILAGLWVNSEKPLMNMFLQPLIENLNKLSSEGVEWKKNEEKN